MSSKEIITSLASQAGIDLSRSIIVRDERIYDRILSDGSLALGESYMEGWWEPTGTTLDELIVKIIEAKLIDRLREASWTLKFNLALNWLYRKIFPIYSIDQSKVVALQHYDLGNELYEEMLDIMVYSCAYFRLPNESLYQAQLNKMELINRKLQLTDQKVHRVLDIGCGWGELVDYLASKNPQLIVDGITISEEQFKHCQEKKKGPGRQFFLCDYREHNPDYKYDAIVSVGMFEHVNPENYQEFMEICHSLLKPGGLMLLHTIGKLNSTITSDPWISKYIFTNSTLPSLAGVSSSSESLFVIEDVHNFGPHYDTTLMHWYKNFKDRFDLINERRKTAGRKVFSQEFFRMWEYYLLTCAGVFRSRQCQLYQVVLSKNRKELYQRPNF